VVVVHHNGDEGDRFRRGSTGVVVGSDEGVGGAPAVTGAEAAPRGSAHSHEAAAVAVGPRRKMTEGGACVSAERGEGRFPAKEAASG
jgi:hypothetical protein